MMLKNNLSSYIYKKFKGKPISKEEAKSYCEGFRFNNVYKDDVLTMTEGYIDEIDLIGIYLFDENLYFDKKYFELPTYQTPKKTMLFVESKNGKSITNLFIHNPYQINQIYISEVLKSIRENFK